MLIPRTKLVQVPRDLAKARKADLVALLAEARPCTPCRFQLAMTLALGCGIPLLSLALSKVSGTLASAGHYALGAFAFALMVAVLSVSLPHLAWSVADLTGSSPRASWALAVALDLSLVLTELVGVYAGELGLGVVCGAVMLAVAVASMLLNCYAFMRHGQ